MGRLLRNAVLVKDIRLRMRSRQSMAIVTIYLAVLAIAVAAFLAEHNGLLPDRSAQTGIELFQTLAIVQLVLVLVVTPASTASAISGERQRGTWELLLVTRLSAFDIIWGKLLAGLAFNLLLVVVPLPLFCAVFLFGGVAPSDLLRTYTVLVVTVVLLTIVSLAVSILSRRPLAAAVVSSAISLFLGFGISLAVIYLETDRQIAGVTNLSELGTLPEASPLTPLAQLDPFVALLSALPDGNNGTLLGDLGSVHHAFGLPLLLPIWLAFVVVTLVLAIALGGLSTLLVRSGPFRLD
jgi:ABC-2 type transport system permease protein